VGEGSGVNVGFPACFGVGSGVVVGEADVGFVVVGANVGPDSGVGVGV